MKGNYTISRELCTVHITYALYQFNAFLFVFNSIILITHRNTHSPQFLLSSHGIDRVGMKLL